MHVVAVSWQVYELSRNPLALGAIGVARIVPLLTERVVMDLDEKHAARKGEKAVSETAELLGLTELQVRTGVRYYIDFPKEIDERIRRNVEEADAAEAAWRREQAALA